MASDRIPLLGILCSALALLLSACSAQQADISFTVDTEESIMQGTAEPLSTAVYGAAISTVTPTATPIATPTSEPMLYELIRLRGYLRDTQSTLLELYQEMPQINPNDRPQLEQQIGELIVETSHFMAVIEQLMDQSRPDDLNAAEGSLQRLQADLQEIQTVALESRPGADVETTPTPVTPVESDLIMADLVIEMGNVQQQVPPRLQQLSIEQLQAVVGIMADVIGDLDELTGYTASTFSRLEMHQQEAFADRGKGIYDVAMGMEWTTNDETPSPWLNPMWP